MWHAAAGKNGPIKILHGPQQYLGFGFCVVCAKWFLQWIG
jgi:hypothetical protein